MNDRIKRSDEPVCNGDTQWQQAVQRLYDVVDVAGIENVFFGASAVEDARKVSGSVEFRYNEYLLRVRSDGWIQVFQPSDADRA